MANTTILVEKMFDDRSNDKWPVRFAVSDSGVEVKGEGVPGCTVAWDWIDDVDALVYHFGDWPVFFFKQLCEALAQFKKNRHIYEALL